MTVERLSVAPGISRREPLMASRASAGISLAITSSDEKTVKLGWRNSCALLGGSCEAQGLTSRGRAAVLATFVIFH